MGDRPVAPTFVITIYALWLSNNQRNAGVVQILTRDSVKSFKPFNRSAPFKSFDMDVLLSVHI
jgi:hypothetical protein